MVYFWSQFKNPDLVMMIKSKMNQVSEIIDSEQVKPQTPPVFFFGK